MLSLLCLSSFSRLDTLVLSKLLVIDGYLTFSASHQPCRIGLDQGAENEHAGDVLGGPKRIRVDHRYQDGKLETDACDSSHQPCRDVCQVVAQ